MKIKNERGITGIDVASGIIIFVIASAAIVNLYYQIYVTTVQTRVHEVAVGCITQVFENIDLINYEEITETKVGELIDEANMNEYFKKEKNNSYVEYSLTNYQEASGVEKDLIKKVTITVIYTVGNKQITFPMSKIKIRE